MTNTNENHTNKTKLIFKAYVARGLLKKGHRIVDIKPLRDDPRVTVFVFEKTVELLEDIPKIIRQHEAEKKEPLLQED